MASSNCFVLALFVALAFASVDEGLAARHLMQLPTLPPLPSIPGIPQQPTLPPIPSVPPIPSIPKIPTPPPLPSIPSFPNIPTTIPSIPFFSPPPSTKSPWIHLHAASLSVPPFCSMHVKKGLEFICYWGILQLTRGFRLFAFSTSMDKFYHCSRIVLL